MTSPVSCRNGCRNCSATTSTRRSWGTLTAVTRAGCCRQVPSRRVPIRRPGRPRTASVTRPGPIGVASGGSGTANAFPANRDIAARMLSISPRPPGSPVALDLRRGSMATCAYSPVVRRYELFAPVARTTREGPMRVHRGCIRCAAVVTAGCGLRSSGSSGRRHQRPHHWWSRPPLRQPGPAGLHGRRAGRRDHPDDLPRQPAARFGRDVQPEQGQGRPGGVRPRPSGAAQRYLLAEPAARRGLSRSRLRQMQDRRLLLVPLWSAPARADDDQKDQPSGRRGPALQACR